MINLLPYQEKGKNFSKKTTKVAVICGFLFFFFLICFILVLFSVKLYFESRAIAEEAAVSDLKKNSATEEINKFRSDINFLNGEVRNQNEFQKNKVYFSDILEKISSLMAQNIYLNNISINLNSVSLSGFAPAREDLLSFKDNLEKESSFENISFPPSDWVKAKDIDFSVTFNLKK